MIRINCPFCGVRDHSEFAYGGDGSITYPALDAPMSEWLEAVYQRRNICGKQYETWQHVQGCRMWLKVERDTTTHVISCVEAAHPGMQAILLESKGEVSSATGSADEAPTGDKP